MYVPLPTSWRFDTRNPGWSKLKAKSTFRMPGIPGVPDDAVAIHANFTFVNALTAGYITVWGEGPKPVSSILNYGLIPFAGCNAVNVTTASDGSFQVFSLGATDLVIDVFGYYANPV